MATLGTTSGDRMRRGIERAWLVGAIALSALTAGCGATGYVLPPSVSGFRIDSTASEVTARRKDGQRVEPDLAGKTRASIAEVLEDLNRARTVPGKTVPARFRAQV